MCSETYPEPERLSGRGRRRGSPLCRKTAEGNGDAKGERNVKDKQQDANHEREVCAKQMRGMTK